MQTNTFTGMQVARELARCFHSFYSEFVASSNGVDGIEGHAKFPDGRDGASYVIDDFPTGGLFDWNNIDSTIVESNYLAVINIMYPFVKRLNCTESVINPPRSDGGMFLCYSNVSIVPSDRH